nr:hypothetical protein [Candidatus Sigynarchaeota archaeon]
MGCNGNPPLRLVAWGMTQHAGVHGGTATRVHARRRRARRVNGMHAPVPAMACRGLVAVVTARDFAARAGAHCSPPLAACRA